MKKILCSFYIFGLGLFIRATGAFAQVRLPRTEPDNFVPDLQMMEGVISDLIKAIFALAGVAAFLFLIVGGLKWVTSSGDPKALSSARGTIVQAVIGLFIAVAAYYLLQVFSEVLYGQGSTNLLNVYIPQPST